VRPEHAGPRSVHRPGGGLTPGQWTVKIATQMTKSKDKFSVEVREDVYENPMTVQAASA